MSPSGPVSAVPPWTMRQVKRATIADMPNVVTYAVVILVKSCEKKTREWVPMGLGTLPGTSNLHRHMA